MFISPVYVYVYIYILSVPKVYPSLPSPRPNQEFIRGGALLAVSAVSNFGNHFKHSSHSDILTRFPATLPHTYI